MWAKICKILILVKIGQTHTHDLVVKMINLPGVCVCANNSVRYFTCFTLCVWLFWLTH